MKTSLTQFISVALCAGALAVLPLGCASTTPVAESSGEYSDDSTITTNVTLQLVEDLGIKKESVKVETLHGIVTLTGAVENEQLRARAGRVADQARGVHGVKNQITLMSDPAPAATTQP